MGYYSDVRVNTTKEGYERFLELIPEDVSWFLRVGYCGFEHVDHDDTVMFGWSCVKWYEGYSEVDAVMNAVETVAREGHPVEYIRIGENLDDVETREHKPEELSRHIAVARKIYSY